MGLTEERKTTLLHETQQGWLKTDICLPCWFCLEQAAWGLLVCYWCYGGHPVEDSAAEDDWKSEQMFQLQEHSEQKCHEG